MLFLAFRNLRARLGRTLFTAFAIALGVALIFAGRIVSVATDEVNRQARLNRIAGADLEVSHSTRVNFGARVASVLTAHPEVEVTAPLLRARADESDLALLGVDVVQTLRPYELVTGAFFTAPNADEILLPLGWAVQNGLGVGDTLPLTMRGQTRTYVVIGLLKEAGLPDGLPTAWLPIQTLQAALTAPEEVTTLLVKLKPNIPLAAARESLQTALGATYLVSSVEAGVVDGDVIQQAITSVALPFAGLVVLLAGAFFIYNAFTISLAERVREIGQLRALGMTRGQVLRLTLTEALLVALAGSIVGLLIGFGLGSGIAAQAGVTNVGVPVDGIIIAVGVGLLVTVGVVFNLARRAGRVSPLAALNATLTTSDAGRSSRWAGVGALLCLILFGIAQWAVLDYFRNPPSVASALAFIPPLVLGGAVLLALPLLVRGVLRICERLSARWGVAARLALHTLARQPGRAALTTITLTISLMLVVFLAGVTQGIAALFVENFTSVFANYDFILGRSTNSNEVGPPLSPALQADVDALAAEAELFRYGSIPISDPNSGLFGLASPGPVYVGDLDFFNHTSIFRAMEGSWAEAERYFAAGPALAIPEIASRIYNLHPGDSVMLDTYEGPVPFTVAVVSNAFILTAEDGARYFHVHPTILFFRVPPGADADALRARAREIARVHQIQFLDDLEPFFTGFIDTFLGSVFALFGGLTSISGIVAGLGIANTLIASVLERQREIGTLRALGFTRGQVRGMVVIEAGLLGFIGTVIGVLGGLGMSLAAQQLLDAQLALAGFLPPSGLPLPWGMTAFALVAGPTLSVLVALWPADRAANVNPADAMRAEGATGFLPPAKHLGPTGLRGLIARLPLAAQLSIIVGVIFVLTLALTTYFRVNYERRLLTDNMRAILQRGFDLFNVSESAALATDVTELIPQNLAQLQRDTNLSVEALAASQASDSPYEFTIEYFLVTDLQHKVLVSDRLELTGETLTETVTVNGSAALVRETNWLGVHVFEVILPIQNKAGLRLGLVRLGLSAEPVDNVIRDIVNSSLWTMVVALAVAVTLTVFFTRRALVPMTQIAEASRAVARGDLSRRVPETRWDDVGQMARAFNEMVKGLTEQQRVEEELRLARIIQHTLLPKELPALPGWQLAAHYRPAREVGGDFYDFLELTDGRLGIVIGDVTDKGVPAALLMAATRSLLRASALASAAPGEVLEHTNNLLQPDIPPKMFVTCLYAILDPRSGHLRYANAGHDQPFHRRHTGEVAELRARGMPLGLMPGMRYEEKETCVEPGECVLFYTDGLVEAHNPQREMFGFPRLHARLSDLHLPEGPRLISALLHELAQFAGLGWEQEDDVTLVVLRRELGE
ncbi:MAG: SpoIIE family protein phosphatase [Anaerolineales bacterium]